MIGDEFRILPMGAVVVSAIEYPYSIVFLGQIAEEFTEARLIILFQLRPRRHSEGTSWKNRE